MNHLVSLKSGWCCFVVVLFLAAAQNSIAQEPQKKSEAQLAEEEKSLAERFDRLELLAGRLAELSKATQSRRAALLQQLVANSREKDLPGRFDEIVEALREADLNQATNGQGTLQTELQAMLELLLQEDRDRQIESERQRIAKYLAELNKLIRQQRGIKARTSGGDSESELSEDQERTADNAGELGDKIESTEGKQKPSESDPNSGEEDGKKPEQGSESDSKSKSDKQGSSEEGNQSESEKNSGQSGKENSQPKESQPRESQPSESKPKAESERSPSEQSQPSQSQPSESQGQPSQGQPSQSQGQSSPSDSPSQQQSQSPSERAVEKLRQAQQRMKEAEQRLKDAQRKEAVEEQEQALRELEQAKAELEKILRQLREEELERMLVLLEARLRKMLEAQNEVYDQTKKMEEAVGHLPEHELEIACASLGRKEDQIVVEADRALVLLEEDGSSVAFPEALQQAREDMQTVSKRLKQVKTEEITQALEEDIIATLEETLAALQQALKELREQRAQQQQGSGEPGEQPLVDQLAELRMIRALQMRINRRTLYYDTILEKDPGQGEELLDALRELAERQEHIFEATRDLDQGTNR
jgi:hypothetical protein